MLAQGGYNPTDIPKVIHYCWFGGNALGEKEITCINSWKRYLPDYEIKRWDESNFDMSHCAYAKEAYGAGKWAFVSDYARFKILHENGGLYFDTDVEIIKSLDEIIELGPFMGMEGPFLSRCNDVDIDSAVKVNPGVGLAAPPKLELYASLLELYEQEHFITPEGDYDETTVVDRATAVLRKCGLKNIAEIQEVAGIYIYPSEYFCPLDFETGELNITDNTHAIHWYGATWLSPSQKFELKIKRSLINCGMDRKLAKSISSIVATFACLDIERIKRGIHKTKKAKAS